MPNNITEKTVAYVRITHEPVFVLRIDGEIALCRRGVMSQAGSYYTETKFSLPELMSEDPSHVSFEELFKNSEGESSIVPPGSDSLLQN